MKPDNKEKLNQCIDILDSTDLGMSLVWLWTWSTVKDLMGDLDLDQLVSEDEAWDLLVGAVESGEGFTLEHGADEHYEHVRDWAMSNGLVTEFDDLDEDDDDSVESDGEEE